MARQPFEDFLNSPGPSNFRGRGRGRGRGAGNGFRGRGQAPGSSRGGRGGMPVGGGKTFKSDYTDVPFDYTKINRQEYTKLEAYSVAPFAPGQGNPAYPRNRYKGKAKDVEAVETTESTPPGAATPVTGLGYRGNGHSFTGRGSASDRAGIGGGSRRGKYTAGGTVGKNGVSWGGGAAPMFVKAGELFKDGEVDVVTIDDGNNLHVDVLPMDDPSAPQMTDLRDDFEIDVRQGRRTFHLSPDTGPSTLVENPVHVPEESPTRRPGPSTATAFSNITFASSQTNGHLFNMTDRSGYTEVDFASFFIDTEPGPVAERPVYVPPTRAPLGVSAHHSDDEEIIFKPKTFGDPEPIEVEPANAEASTSTAPEPIVSRAFVNPHERTRKEKKAAKKDKRGRVKGKGKKSRHPKTYEGSDLDWGTDGPPVEIMDVEDGHEQDMEILRDYLAGTLLNAQDSDSEDDAPIREEKDLGDGAADTGDADIKDLSSGEEDNPSVGSDNPWGADGDTDRGSESEASSELGQLDNLPENDPYKDSEDDAIDAIFAGKDSWDDTDWFIRNMEAALDGSEAVKGKPKQAVFSSIENGDFGDEWDLNPVRKGKKNQKGLIPPELLGQWENDRQTKAEKKRQRELERLVAQIDPSAMRKGRGKIKGNTRAERANLSRLSASEVADMFDIPSDVGDGPGRMNRMANVLLGEGSFEAVDAGIRRLLADPGRATYSAPPMTKEGRIKVHMLAECYGLKSKSKGKGDSRFTILMKTAQSGNNVDEIKIARIVTASSQPGGKFFKALYSKYNSGGPKKRGPGDRGTSTRMRDGETVGEGADKIGMENIGHKLLSRMGWAEGGRIGRTDGGLDVPIMAIVKNTKTGLGA